MSETMGSILARLRKEKNMTQEQLANELGISYQAVSKWENELSSPDISALPLLAEVFGVSIDALFGREALEQKTEELVPEAKEAETAEYGELPWPDDDTLHVVLFAGHRLVGHSGGEHLFSKKQVNFQYEGPALNIRSDFSVTVEGSVEGSVSAGGDVKCDAVGGDVKAQGDVSCGIVRGSAEVQGDVTCGDIGKDLNAAGDVSCGDIQGNIYAGGDVNCSNVGGNVTAGGDIDCTDVTGNANAGGEVEKRGKGFSFRIKL